METPYKIDNVEVVKIYKSEADVNGKPYQSDKGNAFTKVDIYIDPRLIEDPKFNGKITYFDYYDNTASWNVGSTISGEVVRKDVVDRNGVERTYFNFNLPATGKKALELEIKELRDAVEELQEEVFGKKRATKEEEVKDAIGFSKELLKEEEPKKENTEKDLGDIDDLPF